MMDENVSPEGRRALAVFPGGISNGDEVVVRFAIKPTSSIFNKILKKSYIFY